VGEYNYECKSINPDAVILGPYRFIDNGAVYMGSWYLGLRTGKG